MSNTDSIVAILAIFVICKILYWDNDRTIKVKCKCSPRKPAEESIDLDELEIEHQDFNNMYYGIIDGRYIKKFDQHHYMLTTDIKDVEGIANKDVALRDLKRAVDYFRSIENAVESRESADFED